MGRPAPSTAPAGSQTAHLPVTGDTALELKALVWEQPAEDKAERTPGGVTGRAVGGAPGTGGKGAAGAPWGGEWRPQFCFPPVLAPLQGRPPSRTSLMAPLSGHSWPASCSGFWRGRCATPSSWPRSPLVRTVRVSSSGWVPIPCWPLPAEGGLPPSPRQLVTRGWALTPQGTLGLSRLPASSAVTSQVPTREPSLVPQTVPASVGADQGLAWPGSRHRTHCRSEGALAGPPAERGAGACTRTQAPLGF